jgi:cephalosporin-C deacetylase-like acetyl esterase
MRLMIGALLPLALFAQPSFDYDSRLKLDVRPADVEVRHITFQNLAGGRTKALLVLPPGQGKAAAALYVHWYEPENVNSNYTQYLNEAIALGRRGMISLLIETPWTEPEWFMKQRKREADYEMSVGIVKELRRALDVLMAQPRVDPTRVALVGHDFGAMYGAAVAAADPRVKAAALQAGTSTFSHWFLYGPPMEAAKKEAFIAQLKPIDPTTQIAKAAGKPVLLQFGDKDFHVPKARAEEFIAATQEPKKVLWYKAEHGLVYEASLDRQKWLAEQLKLN